MASLAVAVFAAASCAVLLAAPASAMAPTVFNVGDERGWKVPAGNGTESYNHWSKRNRFQVGDVLDFKYANDSVLLVTHDEYKGCGTETPISRFTGGETKFTFDHAGLFYFVSGVPGHCEAGQRMIARVTAPSALAHAPARSTAPAPAPGMPPTAGSYGSGGGAPSAAVSAPGGVPAGSRPSTSSPSPQPPSSGASRRVGLSVVLGLLVGVIAALFVLV
ncbi:hypothetical protein ACP4OV_001015 [Aristida adscensionis]